MGRNQVLQFFGVLVLMASRTEARAYPEEEVAGVNIGGLHAGLKTNLFSSKGPLAQIGNDISAGATQLTNDLASGAQTLENGVNSAARFLSSGKQEEIAGVNIGGLHAGLKTNLFSKNGPLAKIGGALEEGAEELKQHLTADAKVLGATLEGAANNLEANIEGGVDMVANGVKDLGKEIFSTSSEEGRAKAGMEGGAAVYDLNGGMGGNLGLNGKYGVKDTITITGDEPKTSGSAGLLISGQTSGQPETNSQISGGSSGLRISGQPEANSKISGGSSTLTISGQPETNSQITSGSSGLLVSGQTSGEPETNSKGTSSLVISGEPEANSKQTSEYRLHYRTGQNGQGEINLGNGGSESVRAILANLDTTKGGVELVRTITASGYALTPELITVLLTKVKLSEICKGAET